MSLTPEKTWTVERFAHGLRTDPPLRPKEKGVEFTEAEALAWFVEQLRKRPAELPVEADVTRCDDGRAALMIMSFPYRYEAIRLLPAGPLRSERERIEDAFEVAAVAEIACSGGPTVRSMPRWNVGRAIDGDAVH